ncbi:hypothetical protein GE09DRAFT_1264552 [Coniochaeta sp. 2T2.1]|nr:hypothetical protein GE09DRAFT_1264552 [Coniochaeta sp. 2T2.1]
MCNWGRNGPQPQRGESPQDYKRRCDQYNLEQHNAMASRQQTAEIPEQATAPTSATMTTHDGTNDDFEYLGPFRLTELGFGAHLATPPASSASPFRKYTPTNINGVPRFDGLPPPAWTITSHLREPTPDNVEPNIAPGLDFSHQPRTHQYQPQPYDCHGRTAAAASPNNLLSIAPNVELHIAMDLYDDQPGADGHDWLLTTPLSPLPPQPQPLRPTTQPGPAAGISGLELAVQLNERYMKWVTERFERGTDKDKRPDYLYRHTWGPETTEDGETREGWRKTLFYNRERQTQEEYDYSRERSVRLE